MYDVFISYSNKEKPIAMKLCGLLENNGIPCWMAPRNIPVGAHYAGSISQALRNAKIMFLLFSKNANESSQVLRELNLAVRNNIAILPLMMDDTRPNDSFDYYLSVVQWIALPNGDVDNASDTLISASRNLLENRVPNVNCTPPEEAMLDLFDRDMDWIGTARRSAVHREGLWHKTLHCWLIGETEGQPYVYFQRRSSTKRDFPGLLDITAGRHLLAGETDREGVRRIRQELGVDIGFEALEYVGIRTYTEQIGDFNNREYNAVYLFNTALTLRDFSPSPEEVSAVARVSVADGYRLFTRACDSIRVPEARMEGGKCLIGQRSVTEADFVPRTDQYYLKVFGLARDSLAGVQPLSL